MTTAKASARYEAEHVAEWNGRPLAVFNPLGKPVAELPVIYGFNNGGPHQFLSAVLLAEDGVELGGHCCSSEGYMPSDLGCLKGSRPDRHEDFQKHYPDGYRMEFVSYCDLPSHARINAAMKKHDERATNETD